MLLTVALGGTVLAAILVLRQAPIGTAFLIPSMESSINRQIAPLSARIESASLAYEQSDGSVGILLTGVDVAGDDGKPVMTVPNATVELDWISLLTASLQVRHVILREPLLTLRYVTGQGLELSANQAEGGAAKAENKLKTQNAGSPAPETTNTAGGAPHATTSAMSDLGDIIKTLRAVLSGANAKSGTMFGPAALQVRGASLNVEGASKNTRWQIPDFELRLDNRDGHGILVGSGNVVAPSGRMHATLSAEQPQGGGDLNLTTTLDRIVPADLSNMSPALSSLAAALLPVGGEVNMTFDQESRLARLDMNVGLGHGGFDVGGECADSFRLDRGGAHIKYVRGTGRIELLPSDLRSNGSGATVSGLAQVGKDAEGRDRWQYTLSFANATVADPSHGLAAAAIDNWSARGTFTPATGETILDRLAMDVGDARLAMAGRMTNTGLDLQAKVAGTQAGTILRLWPACFQTYARNWVLTNVKSGTISTGQLHLALDANGLARLNQSGKLPDDAASADFEVKDIAFSYADGLPAVIATQGKMQFSGRSFTANIPDAATQLPSGRVLTLSNARYLVADFLDPSPRGRISFETSGPIETGFEYLDQKPLGLIKASGLRFADLTGEFAAKIDLELPVTRAPAPGDLSLKANATLSNVKARRPINGLTLDSGTLTVEATETSLQAEGDVLVSGVPAKLAWTRALGAGSGTPPPLRLTARLDANDREQLGIQINHMVSGEIPVSIDLTPGQTAEGEKQAHVEADLTEAEIVLDTLAWRKPAGQAASATFDMIALDKSKTRLDDFKLTGDNIAVHGSIDLGADRKLSAFRFPEFSINLVTRLSVAGDLRPDNVLDVTARGSYFDGRDFFKSLFSFGQITARPLPPPKGTAGLNLSADIDTVLGYGQVALHGVHVEAERRQGLLTALEARGAFGRGSGVGVKLQHAKGQPRVLLAEADDAGQAFRLIGLYQNLEGGTASLQVNLDGQGEVEKSGTLWARQFSLLGDPVVKEVLNGAVSTPAGQSGPDRERFDFDRMRANFSVGNGQLVLHDMFINGPVIGATLRGRIDYTGQTVQLGGTYIPLFGLNSMFGALPVLGQLLVGRNGEGLLGITFGIQGPLAKPDVIVNPVSAVAPGIFRQIFELGPEDPRIQPRAPGKPQLPVAQASSLPPQTGAGQPTDIGEAFPPVGAENFGDGSPVNSARGTSKLP